MIEIFKKNKLDYVITFLIGVIFFFIPYVKFIPELSGYLLILCLFLKNKKKSISFLTNKENRSFLYILIFYYLWISLNLLLNYSDYNVVMLQKYSGFLLFPFIFSFIKANFKKNYVSFFLFCYLVALTILGTYCIVRGIIYDRMYYVDFSYFHPAWLSMCCSIGLAFSIYLWNTVKKNCGVTIFLIYSTVIYLACSYFAMSRAGIFSLGIVLFVWVLFYLKKMQKLFALLLVFLVFFIFNTKMTNYRNFSLIKDNTRIILAKSAIKVSLSTPKIFFFGVGPTNTAVYLNRTLKNTNITEAVKQANNYNAHNIFLNELLKYGFFAFLSWILIFGMAIIKGIKSKNFLLLSLFLVFLIHFSVDAYILWYRIGIFSFAFLLCFFIFFFRKEKNNLVA